MLGRRLDLLREKIRGLLGDRLALHNVGARYATGDHGDWPELENRRVAVRWYRLGARRGDAECQYDLGYMYLLGEGVTRDGAAGIELMKRAAAQGYCLAIRVLADVFVSPFWGVAADPEQAAHWSRVLSEHLAAHPEDRNRDER